VGCFLFVKKEVRDGIRCSLSAVAAGAFCRSRGAGAYQPHAFPRGDERADQPRLPLYRAARHGQDEHGKDPCARAELRRGADAHAVRRL